MCFKTLLQAGDSDKNTPLHIAARMKNGEIFEYLLKRGRELKTSSSEGKEEKKVYGVDEPRNWLGQTPLFECAKYNRKSFMEKLLSEQPNSSKWTKILDQLKDQNQMTCLHIACYNGSLDIVKYLITVHQISINPYASTRQTPLYGACEGGFIDVVRYLLDYTDANPTIRTAKGYNCLDIAIARHHHEIVKRLLEYPEWRILMESVQYEDSDVPITPMRRLIISMPEIAYELIDKHFTTIIGDADQPKHLIKYDYTFIDDHYNICDWQFDDLVDKPGSKLSKWYKSILTKVSIPDRRHPYTPSAYTLLRNHPLMLMSQCSQEKLITHPLCLALRKAKFRRFSRWILLLSFLSYIMFMALYTIVVLQTIHPQHYYDLYNSSGNASGQNIEWDYGFNSDVCRQVGIYLIESGNTDARKTTNQERSLLMLDVLLIIFVIKNGIFILASFPRFIRKIAYYTEALALVLVYVCIRDDNSWQSSLNFRCPIQWELGSIGLLLSWLVFLSYMRYIPWMDIGLYVVMLNVILLKFLRAIPLLMVLFCGFGFTYYMLLQYQTVYGTPFEAMFRTALSLFDLGYESRLYNPPTGVMYYPVVYFVFILTQIILTILMTNMLIGLALGEIPTLKTQATLLRNKMMYELFFDYEIFHLQLKTIVRIILYFLMCRVCRRRSNPNTCKQIESFFSLFPLNEFIHLRSLSFINLGYEGIEQVSSMLTLLPDLYRFYAPGWRIEAQTISKSKIQVLTLGNYLPTSIYKTSSVTSLRIYLCTLSELLTLLNYTSMLKYIKIDMCSDYDMRSDFSKICAVHLKQLYLNYSSTSFERFELLLKCVPNLKIFSIYDDNADNTIDADRWQHLVKSSLPLLRVFNFNFSCRYSESYDKILIKLSPFQTDFWHQHNWYINYVIDDGRHSVYTVPYTPTHYTLTSTMKKYNSSSTNDLNEFDNVKYLSLFSNAITDDSSWYFRNVQSLSLASSRDRRDEDDEYELKIEHLKKMVNLSNIIELEITKRCVIKSELLFEILKQMPNISSLILKKQITSSFYTHHELCELLNKKIKILDFTYPSCDHYIVIQDLDWFCKTFSNVEELQCDIDNVDDVLLILRLKRVTRQLGGPDFKNFDLNIMTIVFYSIASNSWMLF
ncbi:unnamed protein product [Adineta steineri]|uniref:Ion transport domain-containing protein n=1 Tax=Adineta steineri TaxID=433720 RepID=A0A816E5R3_9BILA|nr:unnamed protein product [Adineta steineri]CAF1642481.1 unnamed protein product [Adineta steineri]